jgi:2-oxoisovalerate dehydrogenase E1 component alpha subunit
MTEVTASPASVLFGQLLPGPMVRMFDEAGGPVPGDPACPLPLPETMLELYAGMVTGRAIEIAATALARQGAMAAYPAALGQEACQVGAVSALARRDWLFPTYRDTVALVTRGVEPAEALAGPLGRRHAGYDPYAHASAPMCTPLATHAPHGVGFAYAARYRGEDTVALVLLGDGATSEGDFHVALNFAAVLTVPVVFLVQNNQYAISTPVRRQSAAPSLAHKAIGYGVPGALVDGNDVLAVYCATEAAVHRARDGGGPALIEAVTFRTAPHTTTDDPSRYRTAAEEARWRSRDPLVRYAAYLAGRGLLTDELADRLQRSADVVADNLRRQIDEAAPPDPHEVFRHVYAQPPATLLAQATDLELEDLDAQPGHGAERGAP